MGTTADGLTAATVAISDATATGEVPSQTLAEEQGSGRPPWWIYLIAACHLATLALIIYVVIWGPSQLRGIVATFEGNAMVVQSVAPDSEAATAGLAAGDRVLRIDDRPMQNAVDWTAATGNWEPGRPHRWLVSRGNDSLVLEIVPLEASIQRRLEEGYVQYMVQALAGLLLGFFVAWKRPGDLVARIGAWFLVTASIAFGLPQGWAAAWRALPVVIQLPLWVPQINRFVLEGIFLSFVLVFPRRLFSSRWPWFFVWTPVLATLPWRITAFNSVIRADADALVVPSWILQAGFLRIMLYVVVAVGVLGFSYRRLLDSNEKRRVRVLAIGIAISAASTIALVWLDAFYGRSLNVESVLITVAIASSNSVIFFCFAYAILRHRVMVFLSSSGRVCSMRWLAKRFWGQFRP